LLQEHRGEGHFDPGVAPRVAGRDGVEVAEAAPVGPPGRSADRAGKREQGDADYGWRGVFRNRRKAITVQIASTMPNGHAPLRKP
jgi:hypothetical protein